MLFVLFDTFDWKTLSSILPRYSVADASDIHQTTEIPETKTCIPETVTPVPETVELSDTLKSAKSDSLKSSNCELNAAQQSVPPQEKTKKRKRCADHPQSIDQVPLQIISLNVIRLCRLDLQG